MTRKVIRQPETHGGIHLGAHRINCLFTLMRSHVDKRVLYSLFELDLFIIDLTCELCRLPFLSQGGKSDNAL